MPWSSGPYSALGPSQPVTAPWCLTFSVTGQQETGSSCDEWKTRWNGDGRSAWYGTRPAPEDLYLVEWTDDYDHPVTSTISCHLNCVLNMTQYTVTYERQHLLAHKRLNDISQCYWHQTSYMNTMPNLQWLLVNVKYLRSKMKGHAAIWPADESGVALLTWVAPFVKCLTPPDSVLYFQFQPAKLEQDCRDSIRTALHAFLAPYRSERMWLFTTCSIKTLKILLTSFNSILMYVPWNNLHTY